MGYYIKRTSKGTNLPSNGKAFVLAADGDISEKLGPVTPPFQPNLVCIVSNGPFEAAGYCFNEREYRDFANPRDTRPRFWFIIPEAAKLSGYSNEEA